MRRAVRRNPWGRSLGGLASGPVLIGASVLLGSVLGAPAARADVHLALGSRLEPLRYTKSFFPYATGTSQRPSAGGGIDESYQSTALSPYIGLFFAQKYGIVLGLDVAYAKSSGSAQGAGAPMPTTEDNSFLSFGIGLGFKSYFTQLKAGRVVPYLYVDIYKYFASVTTDKKDVTGEQASAQASLRSPTGGTLAFGAEYFFSPGFSIGSEIFGLKVQGVSADWKENDDTHRSSSFTQVAFYTGLTLNYRFQLSASVKSAGEADEDKRRGGDAVAPQPVLPPVPQPVPEAVD